MNKFSLIILILLTGVNLLAQPSDTCRILIWDNDAGECRQDQPAAAMNNGDHTMFVFSDLRDGNWNIYGQVWTRFKMIPYRRNFLINPYWENDNGKQLAPDVACHMRENMFFVVWQDSSRFWNNQNRWHIAGCKINLDGQLQSEQIKVSADTLINCYNPKVAVSQAGDKFLVVWEADMTLLERGYEIYARLFNINFQPLTPPTLVNDDGTVRNQRFPDVAASDSGFVVVWQDRRNGILLPMIYGQKYDRDLNPIGSNYLISSNSTYRESFRPRVSSSSNGKYMVGWYYQDSTRIFGRMGNWTGPLYDIFTVTSTTSPSKCLEPDVAMMYDSAFVFTWRMINDYGTDFIRTKFYRGYGDPYYEDAISEVNVGARRIPCIASYSEPPSHSSTMFSIAWFDSVRQTGRGDIFGQYYRAYYRTGEPQVLDSLRAWGENFQIDNLRKNGRKVWYHPKKNYDNPATIDWDEDPIAEPDSIYIPLDSAFVRAFGERNNVPGQQFFLIKDTDSLNAPLVQDQGKANISDYDLCVMDLGYATDALGAGEITPAQQCSLEKFAGSLICSGNDFGEMYYTTSLFSKFGVNYLGPGYPYTTGNMQSIDGTQHSFAQGMHFNYPYRQIDDNSIDVISPGNVPETLTVFTEVQKEKIVFYRSCAYSSFYKDGKYSLHKNIYFPFSLGSLYSDGTFPNTQAELTRRILAFQGFNVEPSPIHDLAATSTNEGVVNLTWTAPNDDTLTEAASKYRLKYRKYNAASPTLGKFSSESEFIDSGQVYFQLWKPQSPGATEYEQMLGLPPGDTLILALKAGDETSPRRWSELGNEPRVAVAGDKVTPHRIGVGYGFGCVKDFISSEQIDVRYDDTLYCTWDTLSVYFGYSRCDWRTAGDLLLYLDTRAGGADSTYDLNGSGAKSAFDNCGDFKPDFCLVVEGAYQYLLKKWDSGAKNWVDTLTVPLGSNFSLDSLNNYEYLELRVPFDSIGHYDTTRSFRYLVIAQQENNNNSWNAFPIQNGTGKSGKAPASYPYYYQVTNGLRSGLEPNKVATPLAVELSQFTAMLQGNSVVLSWRTESETDNYQWLIDRSTRPDEGYQRIGAVPGQGNSPTGHDYTFNDSLVASGLTYYYLLGDQDFQNNIIWHGPVSVSLWQQNQYRFSLLPGHPNPSAGPVSIRYSLPRPGLVSLKIYDISGRKVRTLREEYQQSGWHDIVWDGLDFHGQKTSPGVYFIKISWDSSILVQKLIHL